MQYHVLYNPIAGGGRCKTDTFRLFDLLRGERVVLHNITEIRHYEDLLKELGPEDRIIISGGDGTLNRFLNDTSDIVWNHELLYFAAGSGNDFWHDIGRRRYDPPIPLLPYLKSLPIVTVKGMRRRFINGVGFGIDGYCCEVGNMKRMTSGKRVNYTAIALRGLAGGYHPVNAVVTVDGVSETYENVWLTPTMKGRFFGGGMMPTPNQDRCCEAQTVSCMVMSGWGKWKALTAFPLIFRGKHTELPSVSIRTGHHIIVQFDQPAAMQIDGETIPNVLQYEVHTSGTPENI